jgi:hypothetical protein
MRIPTANANDPCVVKDKQPPDQRRARESSETARKPRAPMKPAKAKARSGTPQQVSALDTRECWQDSVVYNALVDLLGSWQRAVQEMNSALATGKVRSIRRSGERTDGNPPEIQNTDEFWRRRKYVRVGPGVAATHVDEGDGLYVRDSNWIILLSVKDLCRLWPSLWTIIEGSPIQNLEGGKRGPKEQFDWSLYQAKFFTILYDDDVDENDEINVDGRAGDLMEWGAAHLGEDGTPGSSAMRAKVTEWVEIWRRLKAAETN